LKAARRQARQGSAGDAVASEVALVVASHGRHLVLQTADGQALMGHVRGKKNDAVVGDRVRWQATGDEAIIEAVLPRRNLLYRQDEIRTKSFAANLDQVLVWLAAEPEFSPMQLTRALVAARAVQIPAHIVLNKRDVQPAFDQAWARLAPYRAMGESVLPLQLKPNCPPEDDAALRALLRGKVTLVLGPSGSGKSSLINRLVPQAQASIGEISQALNSGRHTTTHTRWYDLPADLGGALIDSPGFQEFGLHHLAPMDLAGLMPDMRQHLGACRFHNCSHRHEPGCAVRAQVQGDDEAPRPDGISAHRYRLYEQLFDELSAPRRH